MKLLFEGRKNKGNVTYRISIFTEGVRYWLHVVKLMKKRSKEPGVNASKKIVADLEFWYDEKPEILDDVLNGFIKEELSRIMAEQEQNNDKN